MRKICFSERSCCGDVAVRLGFLGKTSGVMGLLLDILAPKTQYYAYNTFPSVDDYSAHGHCFADRSVRRQPCQAMKTMS